MAFRAAQVVMAPDGDPERHRVSLKTSKLEMTVVVCQLMNFDQVVDVCRDLVENEGVQSISLCPGCTQEAVGRVASTVGPGVAVNVARGDVSSTMLTGQILAKEGWFPQGH